MDGRNGRPVTKEIGSEPSELPGQEWYLEQFRCHVEAIDELFKACPPQQWKSMSLAIRDALAQVGQKFGLRVDICVKPEGKDP